jgi:hypothetical protein
LLAGFGIMFFNTSDSKITTTIVATSNSTFSAFYSQVYLKITIFVC